ncbi:conserved hypothetical protein [Heliomicrobium modesticaldum Ice1]|uniref:Uncharacterized protein n=1 Tax=Heliobacterium modesticaldum (strain ATCC 51547 / Ice1) TaxID=498761 RepID=B0TCC2_HELMI|nr:hypothetical protein [Heliomicrobium modesticaldum]ABZ85310.1 conserved hypothetical protein [Heliomicrobium modesticaldum Ice1]
MDRWLGWPVDRILILFTSIAFAMVAVQVTLFHYRQNFRHYAMWGPVIGLPVAALIGLALTIRDAPVWRWLFFFALIAELSSGLAGFYYHAKGIGQRVGGWAVNNVMVGPPPVLPIMVSALSLLGLLALYL